MAPGPLVLVTAFVPARRAERCGSVAQHTAGEGGSDPGFYSWLTPARKPRKSFKGNATFSALNLSKHSEVLRALSSCVQRGHLATAVLI